MVGGGTEFLPYRLPAGQCVYNLAFTLNNRIYVKKLQETIPGSAAGHIRHPE